MVVFSVALPLKSELPDTNEGNDTIFAVTYVISRISELYDGPSILGLACFNHQQSRTYTHIEDYSNSTIKVSGPQPI